MSTFSPINIDSSLLLSYYSAQLPSAASSTAANSQSSTAGSSGSSSGSASSFGEPSTKSSGQTPPWNSTTKESTQALEAQILATTNFIPQSTTPLQGGSSTSAETNADNQKLFTLYQAVKTLGTLAGMAAQKGLTAGQLAGYNTRFQTGLSQIEAYISSAKFNNLTLQTQSPGSSVTSKVSVPFSPYNYKGGTIVSDAKLSSPLAGVSSSESFTVAVTKGGATTNVNIDLSQIQGPLTLDNIVNYTNQQLQAAGFTTRFQRTMTSGTISNVAKASYGISLNSGVGEAITLSSTQAKPALFLAGTTGATTAAPANSGTGQPATSADNQGRLIKLTDLSTAPQSAFSTNTAPSSGTTTAQSTVVDSQGNVFVLGNATGNFGSQLNQGTQDVYLSKYDTAGNLQWSKLVGSAGSASGYSMALNPQGGVVIAGSSTSALTTTSIANGKADSFAAAYDTNGNQTWIQQIQTLNANQANAVTVDSRGNVYIGGSVTGTIGSGQTSTGGTNAYVTQLNSSGKVVSEHQFGPSGTDSVAAMATTSDGSVVVASVQNGEAFLSKYASGNTSGTPVWQMDIGSLSGGTIGGLAVSGNQVYVSGTTTNAALNAGGQASIATRSTGGNNAFVFKATDLGTSATANTVSYVGAASGSTAGGSVTVGPDGTVYLAGTTTGTFAGQTRTVAGVDNAYVASLSTNGTVNWTSQFGGLDGRSTGAGVAIDPTGSSVLDALGLPNGKISVSQSVDLASVSTLRAGDSFKLQIEGTGARTATITITKGETLQSLTDQINAELLSNGKATITYASGGEALQIKANAGATISLNAGPAASDALGRLGLAAGVITAPAKKGATTAASASNAASSSFTAAKPVYGLSFNTAIDLATTSDAKVAKISLQTVLNSIISVYQKTNAPKSTSTTTATSQSGGTSSAYLQSQVANYSLAMQSFSLTNSLGTTSSSSSPGYGLPTSLIT